MKSFILFTLIFGVYSQQCTQIKSVFCPDYNGVYIPTTEQPLFDIKTITTINTLETSCQDTSIPGLTAMTCYQTVVSLMGPCNNTNTLIMPCRSACEDMYNFLTSATKCGNRRRNEAAIDNVCQQYPTASCISSAEKLAYGFVLYLSLFIVFF